MSLISPNPGRRAGARAALYARVSRDDEKRILANQIAAGRRYIKAKRFRLYRVYQEIAGGSANRQSQLSELRRDAHRGLFDLAVFTSLSRMTREGIEGALYILNDLKRAGVGWHFVEQPTLNYDTETPRLVQEVILAVLAALDKDYRRRISVATKAAYDKRKALAKADRRPLKWGRPKKTVTPATPDS